MTIYKTPVVYAVEDTYQITFTTKKSYINNCIYQMTVSDTALFIIITKFLLILISISEPDKTHNMYIAVPCYDILAFHDITR